MKKFRLVIPIIILLMAAAGVMLVIEPVEAGVQFQSSFQTPTPNAEGQIIYTVKSGDTCFSIYLLFQNRVPIEDIVAQNGLDEECTLQPGQQLVITTVELPTAMPEGMQPTATLSQPTPTPLPGSGEICVALYEDLDGNQMRSETEFYLAGGVASLSNRSGTYSETLDTVGGDPELTDLVCFEDIPEGDYNVSMGIPDGFNPTTSLNMAIEVGAGDTIVIDFAAQPSSTSEASETPVESGGRSPLLLAVGVILLAGATGLAYFFIRSRTQS
jgi:hypothetical protein